jgi:tetratricopeptide (TPR) repeat protein
MKTAPLLLAVAVLAIAASFLTHLMMRPAAGPADGDAGNAALARIEEQLGGLQRDNLALQKEIAELRSAPAVRSETLSREPALDDLVARAVERWMQENAAASGASPASAPVAAAATFSLETALGQLMNPHLSGDDREALWQEALDSGQLEQLITALEERAAADPRNTALQFELGYAYLQPIMSGQAPGPQAAGWAMKADAAFDNTLKLDATHWDARFNKAVSYTFWPPIMGKQQAAISNFETLVTQQAGMSPRPEFANTYLFLGNLYEQTGQADKAREIWSKGLGLFPGNGELDERLNPR